MVGVSAKKFALHAQNTPKSAFYGVLGEFFAETRLERLWWANLFAEEPLERSCWANFFAEEPMEGLCWASIFAETRVEGVCWASLRTGCRGIPPSQF